MSNRAGFRGYIGSRPYFGDRAPQHVQNLVIRDYCNRQGHLFLLSATEYIMDGCYMILEEVLDELPKIEGIVLYSILMLPKCQQRRIEILERVLDSGAELAGAVENIAVREPADILRIEDIWAIKKMAENAPQNIPSPDLLLKVLDK